MNVRDMLRELCDAAEEDFIDSGRVATELDVKLAVLAVVRKGNELIEGMEEE
jgi:hypothetical protein